MAEQLVPTPEDPGSNPAISYLYLDRLFPVKVYTKFKNEDTEAEIGPIEKLTTCYC